MQDRILNVGVIGLGEVAQVIHLPVLESLPDKYNIAALCDISPKLVQALGEKYRVEGLYTEASELVRQADLDVVFVLNSDEYHAECVIAAADAGKHVLVEKPMTLTQADADAVIEAGRRNNVKVMVGYMRRFAGAFVEAVKEIGGLERIHYVRVRDIIGPNSYFVNATSNVLSFGDIPEELKEDKRRRAERMVREATGLEPDSPYASLYRLLCGLSSHDLSAMREAIGMPKRVLGAKMSEGGEASGGVFLNAVFDYGPFGVTFETGVDRQGRFDAHIEVYGSTKSVRIQYNSPYIRHLPTEMHVVETEGEVFRQSVVRPTLTDPYTRELLHFHETIALDKTPKTTPEDYKHDLTIFRMLIDSLRAQEAEA